MIVDRPYFDSWRYNRAVVGYKNWLSKYNQFQINQGASELGTFLKQEYITQLALAHLGVNISSLPKDVLGIDKVRIVPELIASLRFPYAVEVLGMPGAGKTTLIQRYLNDKWGDKRNQIYYLSEADGVGAGDLRKKNPFFYSVYLGLQNLSKYMEALSDKSDPKYILSERGQIDRRAFRRDLFLQGNCDPKIMQNEAQFIKEDESIPMQLGGVVMLLVDPETRVSRTAYRGVSAERTVERSQRLYEQYLRLHYELRNGEIPTRMYACIDANKPIEDVYEQFSYNMDIAFSLHDQMLAATVGDIEMHNWYAAEVESAIRPFLDAEEEFFRRTGLRVKIVGDDNTDPWGLIDAPIKNAVLRKNGNDSDVYQLAKIRSGINRLSDYK